MGFQFEDDVGPDGFGLGVGVGFFNFASQIAGVAGKTVSNVTTALLGLSVPGLSTGGTLDNYDICRIVGVLNQGGTLTVNTIRGLVIDALYTSNSPGAAWGLHFDNDAVENYVSKLAIGTTSKTVTAGWQFEVYNSSILNGGIQVQQISTAFNYIMDDNTIKDNVALIDTSGMSVVVFLPSPSPGRLATIKDTTGNASTNNIVINSGAANIDGVSGATISTDFGVMRFISDGSNWFVI